MATSLVAKGELRRLLLEELSPRQLQYVFLRASYDNLSKTETQIAELMPDTQVSTLYRWRFKDHAVERALKLIFIRPLETAIIQLERQSVKASKVIIDLMDSVDERIRLKAAQDVLDRLGLKGPDLIELRGKIQTTVEVDDAFLISRAQEVLEERRLEASTFDTRATDVTEGDPG